MASLERIVWFYQRMKEGRFPSRDDYLQRFEVSPSTFKRDLDYLRDRLNARVRYDQQRRGYCLADTSYELPLALFTRPHFHLLAGLGRHLLASSGKCSTVTGDFPRRLESILALADASLPGKFFSFENVEWTRCDGSLIDAILEAMLGRRRLALHYRAVNAATGSTRSVEPYRLHNYMGSWYLIAWCHLRREPRTFNLARIAGIRMEREEFGVSRFDVDAFLAGAFGIFKDGGRPMEVTLRFDPFMARIVANEFWHERQENTVEEGGALVLRFPVTDLTEVRMRVLHYGARVEVLAPQELRAMVAAEAWAIGRLYGAEQTAG